MAMSTKDTLLVMVWHLFSWQISFLDTKVASFVGSCGDFESQQSVFLAARPVTGRKCLS